MAQLAGGVGEDFGGLLVGLPAFRGGGQAGRGVVGGAGGDFDGDGGVGPIARRRGEPFHFFQTGVQRGLQGGVAGGVHGFGGQGVQLFFNGMDDALSVGTITRPLKLAAVAWKINEMPARRGRVVVNIGPV